MNDFFAVKLRGLENERTAVSPATDLKEVGLTAVADFVAVKVLAVVGPMQRPTKGVPPIAVYDIVPVDSSDLVVLIDVVLVILVAVVPVFDNVVAVEVAAAVVIAVKGKLSIEMELVVVVPVKPLPENASAAASFAFVGVAFADFDASFLG